MHWTSPKWRDVGECIYCGVVSDSLQREHAVPYGLNGEWTLLRASCERCARITHRFERDTLRSLLPYVRAVLNMRTRRPKERLRAMPVVLGSGSDARVVDLPPSEYPLYLPAPQLPPPGIVVNRPRDRDMPSGVDFLYLAGPSFEEVAHRFGVDSAMVRVSYAPSEFARTIAKVAYAMAVCSLGVAPFRRSAIRRVILGEDPHFGYLVGSSQVPQLDGSSGLHCGMVRASGTDIHVFVRLFAQFGAPEYHVALGPADPEFVDSTAWPWPRDA